MVDFPTFGMPMIMVRMFLPISSRCGASLRHSSRILCTSCGLDVVIAIAFTPFSCSR
ncbi:Uncharacterised protein [Vibrio cholerae]|nr:Uncharacterised protein [Vibrio cholerae]